MTNISHCLTNIFFRNQIRVCRVRKNPFLPFHLNQQRLTCTYPDLLQFLRITDGFFYKLTDFFCQQIPDLHLLVLSFHFHLVHLSSCCPYPSSLHNIWIRFLKYSLHIQEKRNKTQFPEFCSSFFILSDSYSATSFMLKLILPILSLPRHTTLTLSPSVRTSSTRLILSLQILEM